MKRITSPRRPYGRTAIFFVLVLLMLIVLPASVWGSDAVKLNAKGAVIQISGEGAKPWQLRYGKYLESTSKENYEAHLLVAGDHKAYFSHGPLLRCIDTQHGVVIGRWFFPASITGLVMAGDDIKLEITEKVGQNVSTRSVIFRPEHPEIPAGGNFGIMDYQVSRRELANLSPAIHELSNNLSKSLEPERARALIPELQEVVRRDPGSCWPHLFLGKVLADANEPGAEANFEQAARAPVEYSDLLSASAFLEGRHLPQLADEAFEGGYRDFLARGNDPRLANSIVALYVFYRIDWDKVSPDRRRILAERVYQLVPRAGLAEQAWEEYARSAATPQERELWKQRARDARNQNIAIDVDLMLQSDLAFVLIPIGAVAQLVFVIVAFVLYWPQRRSDKKAAAASGRSFNRMAFFNVQYWSLSQRTGFLLLCVAVWFCAGWIISSLVTVYSEPALATFGNLGGPWVQQFQQLPASHERDFLVAYSFQQGGDEQDALPLYQQAQQYPESWNNLGVIWRHQGKEAEAVKAFQHALELGPGLADASFNLGRPTADYWAQMHQKYSPAAPMLAPPTRDIVMHAVAGGWPKRLWQAAVDALQPWRASEEYHREYDPFQVEPPLPLKLQSPFSTVLEIILCFVILLLAMLPRRPVQQKPGIFGNILTILLPGTARGWGWAGGLVLLAWIYSLLQMLAVNTIGGMPLLLILSLNGRFDATGRFRSPYGVMLPDEGFFNPGWSWVYLVPALLFLLNLTVVLLGKRSRPKSFFAAAR